MVTNHIFHKIRILEVNTVVIFSYFIKIIVFKIEINIEVQTICSFIWKS